MSSLKKYNFLSKANRHITAVLLACSLLFPSLLSFTSCRGEHGKAAISTVSSGTSQTDNPVNDEEREKNPALEITELQVYNSVGYEDASGNKTSWIELHCTGASGAKLSDYTIGNPDNGQKLPDVTLAQGEYYVLIANGGAEGCFTLAGEGSLVIRHNGKVTCAVSYVNKTTNYSYLVSTGGECANPTPGYESTKPAESLVINEILAANSLFPINGVICDWFELYNAGDTELDLSDYYASKDADSPFFAELPGEKLGAGEYRVISCDSEVPFGLPKGGGSLYITRNDGILICSAEYGELTEDISWLRGGILSETPSPGYENTPEGMRLYITSRTAGGLVINEAITSNSAVYPVSGEYYDLLELYNAGDKALNLGDFYLSDKESEPQKYRLPDKTLGAGEYYIVVCSGKGDGHASFKLSSHGEEVWLTDKNGYVCDALAIPALPQNVSWGRYQNTLAYFGAPSFGKENPLGYSEMSRVPVPNIAAGVYSAPQTIAFDYSGSVYYTTDGTKPTKASKKYNGEEITFTSTGAVKLVCYEGDKIPSGIVTYNYYIDIPGHKLPIVSLNADNEELYGENGICTNYKQKKEIETSFSMFADGKECFSVYCGIKLIGGDSRELNKKSFQLKFRAVYGAGSLDYDIFNGMTDVDSFEQLVLRAGEDYNAAVIRDELQTSLAGDGTELLTQAYRYCVLYINGEYQGVYAIKERIDENFVASHLGGDADDVSIVEGNGSVEAGSGKDYFALVTYAKTHDLSVKANYEYLCEKMNMNSFIDWMIAESFYGNQDLGNLRTCKTADGKWTWILYDLDWGCRWGTGNNYNLYYNIGLKKFIESSWKEDRFNDLMHALFKNDEFMQLFMTRLDYHMANTFSNEKCLARLDEIVAAVKDEMARDRARWSFSVSGWNTQIDVIRSFITNKGAGSRADAITEQFIAYFKVSADDVAKYFKEYSARKKAI